MVEANSEWLSRPAPEPTPAEMHLHVLRRLLERDYLNRADWSFALQDLARMAREALGAARTLVAVIAPSGTWSAITSEGERLGYEEISAYGSRSVLESVRSDGKPILTTQGEPLDVDSASVRDLHVVSVLAVPLFFWDVTKERPERQLGGCLYAHRTIEQEPFTDRDVELVLDITRIAQPNLNLLRYLGRLETDLDTSRQQLEELRQSAAREFSLGPYETREPWFAKNVIEPLRRVSSADKIGLLILGPTGSGKSYVARCYHYECARKEGPFITLDCSQVTSAETLSAELFGYAANSGYANAPPKGRPGKAALAHRGTLFIDEIGALSAELQHRLLRLIQNGTYSALGSSEELYADLQIVAATNEDLLELVRQKRFREDLFWRIREITIRLPPLNHRPADIPHLAQTLLESACNRYGREDVMQLSSAALDALVRHDWSRAGNIRGLEHTINRAVLLAPPALRAIDSEHLQFEDAFDGQDESQQPPTPALGGATSRRGAPRRSFGPDEKARLRALLERKIADTRGTVTAMALDPEVADAFGYGRGAMPDSTLAVWIRDLGLEPLLGAERQRREETDLQAIRSAIRQHGSGTAAARTLGMTRDTLVWRLRKAGLSIDDVLAGEA